MPTQRLDLCEPIRISNETPPLILKEKKWVVRTTATRIGNCLQKKRGTDDKECDATAWTCQMKIGVGDGGTKASRVHGKAYDKEQKIRS